MVCMRQYKPLSGDKAPPAPPPPPPADAAADAPPAPPPMAAFDTNNPDNDVEVANSFLEQQAVFGGPGLGTLLQHDPSLAAVFGPGSPMIALMSGDMSALGDMSPAAVKGLMSMMGYLAPGVDTIYTGCPLRVHGRTIGTFCAIYMGVEGSLDPARKELVQAKAKEAGQILEGIVETPA